MEKCEVCIFAKKDLDQHQKELVVNNYSFKYNPTPRLFGIILDVKIKFHIDVYFPLSGPLHYCFYVLCSLLSDTV
jgi:hypothetical protein